MTVHEYQAGGWTALVTDDALALLHPAVSQDVAGELWQLTTTGRPLSAWVEYLASAGIAALPSFAMVEAHPEGLHVLVRGDIDVEVGDRVVTGRGYTTWREEVLPAADVTLRAEPADAGWLPITGGIVPAASVRLAGQQPAAAGEDDEDDDVELTVARMPALAAAVADAASPSPAQPATSAAQPAPSAAQPAPSSAHPAPSSAHPAPSPAESAVFDGDASRPGDSTDRGDAHRGAGSAEDESPPAGDAGGVKNSAVGDDGSPAGETGGVKNSAVGAEGEAAGEVGGVKNSAVGDDGSAAGETGGVKNSAVGAEGEAAGDEGETGGEEESEEDSDDYDFLLWSTEQVRAHEAAAEPAPAPPQPTAAADPEPAATATPPEAGQVDVEATREPEPEEPGTPQPEEPGPPEPAEPAPADPGGIIDSVPGRPRPAAPLAAPPTGRPVDLPPSGDAPPVPHDDGDHDGETILTSELPATSTPVAAEEPVEQPVAEVDLVLSTGPRIEMDRPVLLGRAPEATRFAGIEAPRLVSVANPERDISATHVEIRPAGGHVVVTDMNSTNGTVVHLPDQPPFRLQPGTGVPVAPGAVVELGAGVTVTVERLEEAQ